MEIAIFIGMGKRDIQIYLTGRVSPGFNGGNAAGRLVRRCHCHVIPRESLTGNSPATLHEKPLQDFDLKKFGRRFYQKIK